MAPARRTTKVDPFADLGTETTTNNEEINVAVAPIMDDESGEVEWTATFKAGSGFDAPWLVGRFSNLAAINHLLTEGSDLLKDTMSKAANAGAYFGTQMPVKGGDGASAPAPARPARQQAPGGQSRSCKHGEMTYKTGAKNGNTWQGFFCPTPQGTADQCRPQFLN